MRYYIIFLPPSLLALSSDDFFAFFLCLLLSSHPIPLSSSNILGLQTYESGERGENEIKIIYHNFCLGRPTKTSLDPPRRLTHEDKRRTRETLSFAIFPRLSSLCEGGGGGERKSKMRENKLYSKYFCRSYPSLGFSAYLLVIRLVYIPKPSPPAL